MNKNNKSGEATLFGWYAVTCLGLPDEINKANKRNNIYTTPFLLTRTEMGLPSKLAAA